MKKTIVLTLILLIATGSAFALDFTVGPKVGIGHNGLWGDDWQDAKDAGVEGEFALGGSVGAFVELQFMPFFALQPELLFVLGGANYSSGTVEVENKSRWLELPVLAKGKFDVGPVGAFAYLGPVLRLKVGQWKSEVDGTETDVEDDDLNTLTFAAAAGGGVSLGLFGPGDLTVEARATLGLQSWSTITNQEFRDYQVYMMVGYAIPIL